MKFKQYINEKITVKVKLPLSEKIVYIDFINFMLDYFNVSSSNIVLKIHKKSKKYLGWIDIEKSKKTGTYEIIAINGHMMFVLSSIAHELTHVIQLIKKTLDSKDGNIIWKKKVFMDNKSYQKSNYQEHSGLPWEKEASTNSRIMVQKYKEKGFDHLIGKDATLDYIIKNNLLT